ncbi:hypothetical protein Micbo1qcDRAFT_46190 [Microdochium bolleyi]|uniref:C2H2-type domain-containing protein n=1 Tax=Microdochium bolleyi TaxID=196109 RepID=A0A136JCA7_9PEZI|nr:hypothetical protein Micbo1qcDRAFT_46190 [Microdochium bolleyi]
MNCPSVCVGSHHLDSGQQNPGHGWCCGQWFRIGTELNRHIPLHTKPFPCEWGTNDRAPCTKRFRAKKEREKHYRTCHPLRAQLEGIPEHFRCEHCGDKVRRRDYLKRHYKSCTTLNPGRQRGKKGARKADE